MSVSSRKSSDVPGSPRAGAKPESPRTNPAQELQLHRASSPAPHSPRVDSTWRRATPEAALPSPPGSPRETGSPRRSAAVSLGSRDQRKTVQAPADDLKRNPQIKRLAQEAPDQRAPKRARTASPPASPRNDSPVAKPAQTAVHGQVKATPVVAPALALAKAQLELDCKQAEQIGLNLQELLTLSETMQFRVRDVGDIVHTASEDLDNMICCLGDPDKHEKVEQYRGLVRVDLGRLHKIFSSAPSSIAAHQCYEHALGLASEMCRVIGDVQAEQPLEKASLVDSPGRGDRGRTSPRAEDSKPGAARKTLRVVMDPQKSAASAKGRADS